MKCKTHGCVFWVTETGNQCDTVMRCLSVFLVEVGEKMVESKTDLETATWAVRIVQRYELPCCRWKIGECKK